MTRHPARHLQLSGYGLAPRADAHAPTIALSPIAAGSSERTGGTVRIACTSRGATRLSASGPASLPPAHRRTGSGSFASTATLLLPEQLAACRIDRMKAPPVAGTRNPVRVSVCSAHETARPCKRSRDRKQSQLVDLCFAGSDHRVTTPKGEGRSATCSHDIHCPPNSPGPGTYVAVDFQAAYERAPFRCGYAMWLLDQGSRSDRSQGGEWHHSPGIPRR